MKPTETGNIQDLTNRELPIRAINTEITPKVGKFIVVNTPTIKGVRINLEKIRTYGKAGRTECDIQVAWDNGTASVYTFGTEEASYTFLDMLDEHCL